MDVICLGCGRHFGTADGVRDHKCEHPAADGLLHWKPSEPQKVTLQEWERMMDSINFPKENKQQTDGAIAFWIALIIIGLILLGIFVYKHYFT